MTESRLIGVATLIDAVEDPLVSALIVLGDFDDGAQVLAGMQRALPCIGDVVRRSGRGLSGRGRSLGMNWVQMSGARDQRKKDGTRKNTRQTE